MAKNVRTRRDDESLTYLESGEMNAGRECWRGFKDLFQGIPITQVDLVEYETFLASAFVESGKFCDSIEGNHARIHQIVDDHNIIALL